MLLLEDKERGEKKQEENEREREKERERESKREIEREKERERERKSIQAEALDSLRQRKKAVIFPYPRRGSAPSPLNPRY